MQESQRAVPGFLINSLSDNYNSPGRLAEYRRQFLRVVRQPGDDPSVFAIELETLARRAFIDIDSSIQCALRRHLDSLKPDTPMSDIVDSCRVWESHRDVETEPRTRAGRRPVHAGSGRLVPAGHDTPAGNPLAEMNICNICIIYR